MKKLIILGWGLLICSAIQSQQTGNYLHFNVGGGLNNLSYNLKDGTEKGQFGYTLNAAYSYFFTSQWGVQSGIGLQSFNSLSTINLKSVSSEIDTDGQTYEFRTNYKNWQEKQQILSLDIPIMGQFKHFFDRKFGILAALGAKISIPIYTNYKTTDGQIVTTGYYNQWNVELADMPQHGFTTYTNSYSGNLTLKPSFMAVAELGGLYKLSRKTELYIGGYFNYGLNNILKPDSKLIFQPNAIYNGFFASSQTNNVLPISIGIKVGLYWQFGKKYHYR
jgi:hypothetical protein